MLENYLNQIMLLTRFQKIECTSLSISFSSKFKNLFIVVMNSECTFLWIKSIFCFKILGWKVVQDNSQTEDSPGISLLSPGSDEGIDL